ncbi:hypothetical protein [Agrococcus sp. ProA11]|uniref:hypothetical protein n=1 Tax=Agrococcus chionoecetis TaxID=3153752 RepID=UPI00326123B9
MGLTRWVTDAAVKRVHVMIVEVPGSGLLRMRAEAAVTVRGWALASSPADTDAILVCGSPHARLSERIDAVWDQVPAPRTLATVADPARLASTMDAIAADLADTAAQRARARRPRTQTADTAMPDEHAREMAGDDSDDAADDMEHAGHDMDHTGHDMDHTGHDIDHTGHDIDHTGHDIDHTGHDMDHTGHDMDMSGPGGIPLAEGAKDRDGLEMDATHLTLGPILADWPAALVLHCTLHGDVVADAEVEWWGVDEPSDASVLDEAARACDAASRVLAVAGWDPMAARVRRIRNDILGGVPTDRILSRLTVVMRRIERSRTLAWTTSDVARDAGDPRRALMDWLRACSALLEPVAASPILRPKPARDADATADAIRSAVVGHELSAVRLLVASLGLDHAITREAAAHE